MIRSLPSRMRECCLFFIVFLGFLVRAGQAQSDALNFFKNYFVTGDYVAAGTGLRGLGKSMQDPCLDQKAASACNPTQPTSWAGSYAKGNIQISGLPVTTVATTSVVATKSVPADIVAAFLYWETDEASAQPSARRGVFDGHPIVGAEIGNRYNPVCDTSTTYGNTYGR